MITFLLPSKGRREKTQEAIRCFNENKTTARVLLVLNDGEDYDIDVDTVHVPAKSMCEAVNLAWGHVTSEYVGFLGDDHFVRTKAFDEILERELQNHPIVYGNDLLQSERLATHCAMDIRVPKALGYMAIPGLKHLYMDNFWMELGAHYVPEVIIEHMHYTNGKSVQDERYSQVNSPEVVSHDQQVFNSWKQSRKQADLALIQCI